MRPRRSLVLAVAVLALAPGLFVGSQAGTPTVPRERVAGGSGLEFPDPTDAGRWEGTWIYLNRSERWALWLRDADGVPQMKLRYLNMDKGEGFETDWSPQVEYVWGGKRGVFRITITARDAQEIRGAWYWQLGVASADPLVRTERAKIVMHRAGSGRELVLKFSDFERVFAGAQELRIAPDVAWTFTKASRRIVLWSELPF